MAEYSCGPWSVSEQWGAKTGEPEYLCFHAIEDGEGRFVSSTWARPHEANARLIAAAPDLLEALQDLMDTVERVDPGVYDLSTQRAAIAKAKGEA